jgi:hypothetical protein
MFIRGKRIKGNTYYYLVKSERHGKKVIQKYIGYVGKSGMRNQASLAGKVAPVRSPTGLEALAREALKYKRAKTFVKRMREGVELDNQSMPDMLRVPLAELWEARRYGRFTEIRMMQDLVEKNLMALNKELRGMPFSPNYFLNDYGKVEFHASDFTALIGQQYEPIYFGKKISTITPREAKEFIARIEEQVKHERLNPLIAKDRIEFLDEIRTGRTLTDFYQEVWEKMSDS